MIGDVDLRQSISLLREKSPSNLESDIDQTGPDHLFKSRPWMNLTVECLRALRPSACRTLLFRSCVALLPTFIQQWTGVERAKPEKLSPTSHLDGMRGLAALFVFFCHYSYTCFIITRGYGYGRLDENTNILQLPFIRLLYSGPPMVCLFFVISGYALSLKPLKLSRSQSWDKLFNTMSSSVFRRGIRLFIPASISTFIVATMVGLGWYEPTREFATNKNLLRNIIEHHPERLETFYEQLCDWGWKFFNFIHVWGWEPFGGSTTYDVHLWTIPVEFRCSLMLFITIIGLARLQTSLRFIFLALIAWFTYRNNRWEMVLFFAGMFLAELDLLRGIHNTSSLLPLSTSWKSPLTVKHFHIFWVAVGILGLYLMSQPDDNFAETPGWVWLSSYIPEWFTDKYRYWQCVGSIFFVLATNHSIILQHPFNNPIVQYLGKISYSIYLVHGPVLHVIGYRIEPWAWSITGSDPGRQYNSGFLLGSVCIIPITIWVADLFWRAVDVPTVRFARWLEQKCCATEGI